MRKSSIGNPCSQRSQTLYLGHLIPPTSLSATTMVSYLSQEVMSKLKPGMGRATEDGFFLKWPKGTPSWASRLCERLLRKRWEGSEEVRQRIDAWQLIFITTLTRCWLKNGNHISGCVYEDVYRRKLTGEERYILNVGGIVPWTGIPDRKTKVDTAPASIPLCFQTVGVMWPAALHSWHNAFPPRWPGPSTQSRNKPLYLHTAFHWVSCHSKKRSN